MTYLDDVYRSWGEEGADGLREYLGEHDTSHPVATTATAEQLGSVQEGAARVAARELRVRGTLLEGLRMTNDDFNAMIEEAA